MPFCHPGHDAARLLAMTQDQRTKRRREASGALMAEMIIDTDTATANCS